MEVQEKSLEPIPTWALSSIIFSDDTGLTDDEIIQIEEWFDKSGFDYVCAPDYFREPRFTHYPAFGLPCEVIDCWCIKM